MPDTRAAPLPAAPSRPRLPTPVRGAMIWLLGLLVIGNLVNDRLVGAVVLVLSGAFACFLVAGAPGARFFAQSAGAAAVAGLAAILVAERLREPARDFVLYGALAALWMASAAVAVTPIRAVACLQMSCALPAGYVAALAVTIAGWNEFAWQSMQEALVLAVFWAALAAGWSATLFPLWYAARRLRARRSPPPGNLEPQGEKGSI